MVATSLRVGFWFSPEMEFILHAVKKSQDVCAALRVRVRVRASAQAPIQLL
jgi:hypothetical protein